MKPIVVFLGPTLERGSALEALPGADCRGPAARGDVYAASCEAPAAICVIDGYFEHRAAVTHKEILWALSRDIPVFGSSSMGALRAAELQRFGMVGCGWVFERFASGELEDDDEVAVAHAAAEDEYRAGSEAMVNLRATMDFALARRAVSPELCRSFLTAAKALFYPERSHQRVLRELRDADDEREGLDRLEAWLSPRENRIDQKRIDALEMLHLVARLSRQSALATPSRDWRFPMTRVFREACLFHDRRAQAEAAAIAEEIQLLGPETYSEIVASARLRALALSLEARERGEPESGSSPGSFEEQEQRVVARMPSVHAHVVAEIENVLRALGDYERVASRAARKRQLCRELPASDTETTRACLDQYFRAALRREVPQDLESYAQATGFTSVEQLVRAVRREVEFLRLLSVAKP